MSGTGKSSWRRLVGSCELCGLCHKETTASANNHLPRTSSVLPSRTSAALPPDQVSLRSLPPASPAPISNSQPPSLQPSVVPIPKPTPVAPVTTQVSSAPQSAPDPSGTPQVSSASTQQQTDLRQLWDEAITKVKHSPDGEKLAEVIQVQQNTHPGDPDVTLTGLMSRLENEMKRVGLKGKIADFMGKVVPHLNRFAIVGDIAVSTNLNPAALPWAAVRFILLNLTAGEEIRGKIIEGIVEITILEFECSVYQEVHLASPNPSQQTTRQRLRDAIVEVFALSIKLLGFALQRQRSATKGMTDAFRIEDFTSYVRDLATAKIRLHDAGHLCDMYHNYESRGQLKELHDLVRRDINEGAEYRAKMQLKGLLIDPKDAFDHIYHPENSFCLEGTRVAVLRDIERWSSDLRSPCVCWLPGLAGTGKSTISRTIARDLKGKSLGASFFFKTGAGNRGDGRFVFSIIAYQLALNFPPIRPHILEAIKKDSASAMAPMKVQWQRLILNPLSQLQNKELGKPLVLVMDALDECEENDRKQILQLLQTSCPAALRVFITSRPEVDIEGQFLAHKQLHQEIVLHRVDVGTIKKDIAAFLKYTVEEFVVEYNQCHPQKDLKMDVKWPGDQRFQQLVERSLPLFIAAATFIRMIKDRYWTMSPDNKINFIIEESTKVNSEYDAMYRPVLGLILCRCPEGDRGRVAQSFVNVIGSFILLASPLSITGLANLLDTDAWEVMGQIDALRSVIDVPSDGGKIKLFHLSFRDYLLSKSAGELQVDEVKCHEILAKRCIDVLKAKLKKNICGLGSPGTRTSQIDPVIVDKYIPTEVQYACLYWAFHLRLSGTSLGDPDKDNKARSILEFLQTFFSNWMEVLCLIGKIDYSLIILNQLQAIVVTISRNRLSQFIYDARQFIHYFHDGILNAPLQIYYSGVLFSPESSIVPQPLADRQYPDLITKPTEVESSWPQSLHIIRKRWDGIFQMAFTSNGRLISMSLTGQIDIWDTESGSCQLVVSSNKDIYPGQFAIWRDDIMAKPSPGSVVIWNAKTGIRNQELYIDDHMIYKAAFTDDGKFICLISKLVVDLLSNSSELSDQDLKRLSIELSEEYFIHIHNLSTGECVRKYKCGVDLINPKFSVKGQWIASESMMLARWDPYNDLRLLELESEDKHITLGFSSDGTLLASTRSNLERPLEIKIWCTGSTECVYTYSIQDQGTEVRIGREIGLTKHLLVYESINGGAVFVWLETGQVFRRPDIRVQYSLALSPDGKILATQSSPGVIKIWDLTSVFLARPLSHHSEPVEFVAPIADENTTLSSTKQEVKIWDTSTGHCTKTFQQKALEDCRKFPLSTATNAPLYATWSKDQIEIWDLDLTNGGKQLPQRYGNLAGLEDVALSANGERLAAILYDHDHSQYSLKIWDVKSASLLQEFYYNHDEEVGRFGGLRLAISHDGTRVVYTTPTTTELQYVSSTHPPAIQLHTFPYSWGLASQLTFHHDRVFAVTGARHLQSFDHKTGEEIGWRELIKPWRELDKSFIDIETVHGTSSRRGNISDFTKPYYTRERERWLHRKGDDVLWLPANYIPRSACVVGSMVVIGTVSGRVLFLHLRDQG